MDPHIKTLFPIFQQYPELAYLDNAATTQKPASVINRISQFYASENSNIQRGLYRLAHRATLAYEDVRNIVATFLNARSPENIAFTSGTTESINIVAQSFVKHRLNKGDNILISILEHHANLIPWQQLAIETGAEVRYIKLNSDGKIDLDHMETLLDNNTKFVSICHISNTLGTVQPIEEIKRITGKKDIPLLIDAAQSATWSTPDVEKSGIDFLVFSGHKLFGPLGTGVLYISDKYKNKLKPFNFGGGIIREVFTNETTFKEFPFMLESGTPDVAGIVGLGSAIDFINSLDKEIYKKQILQITDHTLKELSAIPEVVVLGKPDPETGIISFNVKNIHPHEIASFLSKDNIAVRAGYHCTHPLMEYLQVNGSVRVSYQIYNDKTEADRLIRHLKELIALWN